MFGYKKKEDYIKFEEADDEELGKIYEDDDDEDDPDSDFGDTEDCSDDIRGVFGLVMIILATIIIALLIFFYFFLKGQYETTYTVDFTNKKYLEMAENIGGDTTYMVSALGYDMALNDIAEENDFGYTQRVALTQQSGRNFKSLKESDKLLDKYSKGEDIQLFESVSNKELSEILGVDYKLSPAFNEVDRVIVYNMPSEFDMIAEMYEENLYLTGTYYKSDAAFKVPMADGKHDMIWFRDELPSSNAEWTKIDGTLCVPSVAYVCTSSANQTVEGIIDSKECSLVEVLNLSITSEKYLDKFIQYSNRVGIPYNLAIVNSATGIVVASGVFDE